MLQRMQPNQARVIGDAIEALANGSHDEQLDIKALINRPESRLRIDNWRVIFTRDQDELRIERIAVRGDAY